MVDLLAGARVGGRPGRASPARRTGTSLPIVASRASPAQLVTMGNAKGKVSSTLPPEPYDYVVIGLLPSFALLFIASASLLLSVARAKRGAARLDTSWALGFGLALSVIGLVMLLRPPGESFVIRAYGAGTLLLASERLFRAGIAFGLSERSQPGSSGTSETGITEERDRTDPVIDPISGAQI